VVPGDGNWTLVWRHRFCRADRRPWECELYGGTVLLAASRNGDAGTLTATARCRWVDAEALTATHVNS
jgi:hypothetical protein